MSGDEFDVERAVCSDCEEKVKVGIYDGDMVAYCGCNTYLKVSPLDSAYLPDSWL